MQKFVIDYKEISSAYFVVEAENEEDALERFELWRINDDTVYNEIMNTDWMESASSIAPPFITPDSIYGDLELTDERYRELRDM